MNHRIEKKYLYRYVCALILTIIASGLFFAVWFIFVLTHNQTGHLLGLGNLGMALGIYMLLYIFIGRSVRAFKIGVERKASVIAAQIVALGIVDVLEQFLSLAITGEFRFFWMFAWRYVLLLIAQCIIICPLVIVMINIYRSKFPPLQLLEIYGDMENDLYSSVNSIPYKYQIIERKHYSEGPFSQIFHLYDGVLINDIPAQKRNDILKECFRQNKRVYFTPKLSDILVKSSDNLNLIDTPVFLLRNNGISIVRLFIKRAFDICSSLAALIVLSPLFAVVAIAIKADDGGPVFYRQERCTIDRKRFMIIKFRSMIVDAEKDGKSHPAGEHDDRITKVGHVIRATRIDELPQLINILKGDMSVVGPRPERVEHVNLYTDEIPEFAFRYKVKGGLTGYAQVYGKYNTTALDKLKMDLIYVTNFSLRLDFQIIVETLKILFRKESTEGFSEDRAEEIHDKAMFEEE